MESGEKRPKAIYEPGELEKTRRNIGNINREEAEKMTKVLGGEIGYEKSAPIDMSAMPKKHTGYARNIASQDRAKDGSAANSFVVSSASETSAPYPRTLGVLPEFSPKDRQQADRLMMSLEYRIKPNYGIFNFIMMLSHSDKVLPGFVSVTLKTYISYIQSLCADMSALLNCAPDTYRQKVLTAKEMQYRFCQIIETMPVQELSNLYDMVSRRPQEVTVAMLMPVTRGVYRCVLPLSFLGETRAGEFLKSIAAEMSAYGSVKMERVQTLAENIFAQFKYVTKTVHKGMYPLLMRMCTNAYTPYPEFFTERISKILPFLDLTKYDLLLPEKQQAEPDPENIREPEAQRDAEPTADAEAAAEPEKESGTELSKQYVIKLGLVLLDRLFPDAGWLRLQEMPDMYPYFQPLYEFDEGFNLLANDNPLQVMVVLLRILEDLFQGCRNIKFDAEANPQLQNAKDNFTDALNTLSVYRQDLFDKRYAVKLKEYVNAVYSQKEFAKGQFGKKLLTDILWQTKYYFLPHFEFTQILLEKPANDSTYRPLCLRTEFIHDVLIDIVSQSIKESRVRGFVSGVPDIWQPYRFGIPNVVSNRLDALLGAKRKNTQASNASLLKYTLGVAAVLNWWINDQMSPAYQCAGKYPYRISPEDGDPLFSVPVRSDQNKVFAKSLRDAVEKKKAQNAAT